MCWKKACALFLFFAATTIVSRAQTLTTLFNFDKRNGFYPGSLVSGHRWEYVQDNRGWRAQLYRYMHLRLRYHFQNHASRRVH